LDPARGIRVLELAGPAEYSPEDIRVAFSTAFGKPVQLQTHPAEAIEPVFTGMGLSPDVARLYREMIESANAGRIRFAGTDIIRGKVTALEAISALVGARAAART
jgi:hypothetical protein